MKKRLEKTIKADDLTTITIDIKGKEYDLFINQCSDGLYSVDFGGRLGDIDAVVDLLSRLEIKVIAQ